MQRDNVGPIGSGEGIDSFDSEMYSSKFLMRNRIIQVAEEMFRERGYTEISVKDICSKVGISRQTFYRHFTSKADMGGWLVALIVQRNFSMISPAFTWEQALATIWDDCARSASNTMIDPAKEERMDRMMMISRKNIKSILVAELRRRNIALTTVLDLESDLFAITMSSMFFGLLNDKRWIGLSSADRGTLFAKTVPAELRDAMLHFGSLDYRILGCPKPTTRFFMTHNSGFRVSRHRESR